MNAIDRGIAAFVAAAGLVAFMPAAARADSCPPDCPAGHVRLGIAVPTGGPAAAIGISPLKAAEIAIQDLNASGGLLGVPVKSVVGDDRCDAGMAATVAKRHIEQDKIDFLIGPLCPAVALDAAPIYAKAGVIQFVPAVTVVELTLRNPNNIFRVAANDEQEARALVRAAALRRPGRVRGDRRRGAARPGERQQERARRRPLGRVDRRRAVPEARAAILRVAVPDQSIVTNVHQRPVRWRKRVGVVP
jgi:branched-chain amino acid transport system substrate-binding protein